MTPEGYTWTEFKQLVTDMLTVDSTRSGIATYREKIIRQAVIQLQDRIDAYRLNHETVYHPSDLVVEGSASRGVKPPQSVIRELRICEIVTDATTGAKHCHDHPVRQHPWAGRFDLVSGGVAVNDGAGLIAIDPQGYTFYLYPELFDCWQLSLHWDGLKIDFQDEEEVPFDEAAAGAAALFVKAQIVREVERDLAAHDSYMKSFQRAVGGLFVREREKAQTQRG